MTQQLDQLLAGAQPEAPRPQRHLWLIDLLAWVRKPVAWGRRLDPALALHRWDQVLQALDAQPEARERVMALLESSGRGLDAASLLADHGFAPHQSLFSEFSRRLAVRWLPRSPDTDHLGELLQLLFEARDTEWLAQLNPLQLQKIGALLRGALPWRTLLLDALTLQAAAISGAGHAPGLRRRMSDASLQAQPFRQLPLQLAVLREALDAGEPSLQHASYLRAVLDACRSAAASVFEHLEAHGVSVDIVFAAEQLQRRLRRFESLLDCLLAEDATAALQAARALLLELVAVNGERGGLRALFAEHSSLLARQMAERHAETGEHYITTDRAGWMDMLRRAAGGGAVIAGTTLAKFAISALALGAFWGGFWAGVNYAVSFLIVMLLHWTVATKQPAMTAPALADSLAKLKPGDDNAPEIEGFVDRVAQLMRSQFAGIVGNVLVCFPLVLAVQLLAHLVLGQPLVGAEKAEAVLQSQTLLGPTLFFAAFTGILLFASSLIAGWAENAFVLHRLDSAMAWNPRITRWLGAERAKAWAAWWRTNISGVVANTSLGLMLGLVPALLGFLGLGLEVRHVTLASGQLAAALGALGWPLLLRPEFWWCMAAIVGIGVLNVGVSFWLALRLALRSRGVRIPERRRLAQALRWRLRQAPLSFLLPTR